MIATLATAPENRHIAAMLTPAETAARIALLERAAEALGGQRALARVLNVAERSVRAWLAGDRGIGDGVLNDTAMALVDHSNACLLLSDKIMQETAPF